MKALTVGGAMVDTIAIIESDRIERMTMRNADTAFLLLEEGRKTESLEVSTHVGGGAVNTAVAMSRLGLDVATLVKLGRDVRAETVMARLIDEGVSTRWVLRDKRAPTGASVMISSHERDAAIFTFRGANTLLELCDLREDAFATDLVYISSLSNESAACFPDLIARAKVQGALVATNPGVRQLSARGGTFLDCLENIDILNVNRREADALVPSLVARFGEGGTSLALAPGEEPAPLLVRGLESGGFEITLAAFVTALLQLGVNHVVITDGSNGAFVGHEAGLVHCPTTNTHVMGTAGAGDAFASTFAASFVMGQGIEEAVQSATINAASVISHVDTQTGLLDQDALLQERKKAAGELTVRTWEI